MKYYGYFFLTKCLLRNGCPTDQSLQQGKKSRLLLLTESSLQTQQRLRHQRIRQANLRASEEPVETQQRLQQQSIRQENFWPSEEPMQTQQ
ncbi:hypothetical protein AVEN_144430-1 [Araneus ventricosus]|uniref:Uncharacterized protein n=1 Tax=Araneus ventricosus TaxID=182803 RepID=A0A4Y2E0R1_ARAVE|nr:hypothetical protein AVEN_144430-1 [Araneus ventricosus]